MILIELVKSRLTINTVVIREVQKSIGDSLNLLMILTIKILTALAKTRLTVNRLLIREVHNLFEDDIYLLRVLICYDPYCTGEKQAND